MIRKKSTLKRRRGNMSQLQRGGINYHNVKWRCHKCDINGSEKYPKKCPKCKGPIWTSEKADKAIAQLKKDTQVSWEDLIRPVTI